jgi:hypothetical protein
MDQNMTGAVMCLISPSLALGGSSSMPSSFSWTYFTQPIISNLNPSRATVGGFSGSSEGNTVLVTVQDLPAISTIAEVKFFFQQGSLQKRASVLSFQPALGITFFTISVPPTDTPTVDSQASVQLLLEREGFETRIASTNAFGYYVPAPSIFSIRWCNECNIGSACILNGRCGNSQMPLSLQLPINVEGYLIIVVKNMFNISVGSVLDPTSLFLQFADGATRPLWRISSRTDAFGDFATVGLEFSLGNVSSAQCSIRLMINSTKSSLSLGGLSCFQSSLTIQCRDDLNLNSSMCAGPSEQSSAPFYFVARILGLFTLKPEELPTVSFGVFQAASVERLKSDSDTVDLRIRPPSNNAFSQSSLSVPLVIVTANGTSSVSTVWTFWKAPSLVSAKFDTLGTRIVVLFDQATNQGGMGSSDQNC